jgi:hypothetical protein
MPTVSETFRKLSIFQVRRDDDGNDDDGNGERQTVLTGTKPRASTGPPPAA